MAKNVAESIAANGTFFKSDLSSRVEGRRERKRVSDSEWRACCKGVDVRDKGRCRVCGRRGNPESASLLDRLHRHHITMRSKGRDDSTSNVVSVCSDCHAELHRHVMDIRGDADAGVEVWRCSREQGWYLSRREVAPFTTERD